jgi:hypothetical protein
VFSQITQKLSDQPPLTVVVDTPTLNGDVVSIVILVYGSKSSTQPLAFRTQFDGPHFALFF